MQKIDAHQHFWRPGRGDYGWMPKDNAILNRDYDPADLAPFLSRAGIDGTVLVQAAPTVAETDFMLSLAGEAPFIKGVVGWINFENRDDLRQLERLKSNPRFKGVRPMIQDIPDVDWVLRPDIAWAFDALVDLDLTFDALGYPQHIENFTRLLSARPKLRTVIDHCLKPRIREDDPDHLRDWADGMKRLAQETDAALKFSALVTEDRDDWTIDRLRPYALAAIDAFGADRTMWGSDWPVARLRCEYPDWLSAAKALTEHLPVPDRNRIFGGTAIEFYRLTD